MPALQIKDCPEDIYIRLKNCASRENRNLSQQMLSIIEHYLDTADASATSTNTSTSIADTTTFTSMATTPYIERNDNQRFIARRKATLERISKLPRVVPAADGTSIACLVRESRDEAR